MKWRPVPPPSILLPCTARADVAADAGAVLSGMGRKRNVMPYQRLNRFHRLAMLLALMLFMPAARADEEDTRFLLHQQSRQAAERMAGPEDGLVLHAPPGVAV